MVDAPEHSTYEKKTGGGVHVYRGGCYSKHAVEKSTTFVFLTALFFSFVFFFVFVCCLLFVVDSVVVACDLSRNMYISSRVGGKQKKSVFGCTGWLSE